MLWMLYNLSRNLLGILFENLVAACLQRYIDNHMTANFRMIY